jgi:hypothetical protein
VIIVEGFGQTGGVVETLVKFLFTGVTHAYKTVELGDGVVAPALATRPNPRNKTTVGTDFLRRPDIIYLSISGTSSFEYSKQSTEG